MYNDTPLKLITVGVDSISVWSPRKFTETSNSVLRRKQQIFGGSISDKPRLGALSAILDKKMIGPWALKLIRIICAMRLMMELVPTISEINTYVP